MSELDLYIGQTAQYAVEKSKLQKRSTERYKLQNALPVLYILYIVHV